MPGKKTNTSFNWFQIFKAGNHTDSKGVNADFTEADLQSVVDNFKPQSSPLVIGHPKVDDPAWGWTSELKIEGGVLFAKAEEVATEFAQAVEDKRYPNRSVRLNKVDNGYELGHIGFLGGKPPAVDGLAWQFNADTDGVEFEFSANDKIDSISLQTSNVVTRLLSNLRTFITDKFDTETANQVIPEWQAEYLKEDTVIAEHERRQESHANNTDFSTQTNHEDNTVTEEEKKALQDSLDAERAKNKKLQFAANVNKAQHFIDTDINGGKSPRLTNTDGVAEFMAHLAGDSDTESATFEFAATDGNKAVDSVTWFKSFLQGLPEQGALTKDFSKDNDDGEELDAQALADKAIEFQQSQKAKGVEISLSSAMQHITQETK